MMNIFNYLRISVTDRCNLKCRYCEVNPSAKLRPDDILSFEEIAYIARLTAQMGVKTVRITGGEPLVRKSITGLFKMISEINGIEEMTFTTNGINLDLYASELFSLGIKRFNLSLDTLDRSKYSELTGGGRLEKVIDNIQIALKTGFSPIKMNVVALKGINDGEIFDFIDFASKNSLILRFIELMDISANAGEFFDRHFMPAGDIKKIISARYKLSPCAAGSNERGFTGAGPAAYESCENGLKIGFISPVTSHFCDGCNRLRLTANGILKSCLLRSGETNIMKMIRGGATEEELKKTIQTIFDNKEKARGAFSEKNIMFPNMSQIGG
jgi:cyclic pyranopterin phosphate synthase